MTRIGPKMLRATQIVSNNDGCSILLVAKRLHIGARTGKNNALGYEPVWRAVKAGLLVANARTKGYGYELHLTEKGRSLVS